ncbi:uncharacterized protein LOC125015804 [Mugil cephalus]|uniref:uncharacterized protein LOC125015804 n=1 Tax=Mugil cephalus TaxID=48193 RepID=UPI001FB682A6|nr:uncharacterized protein LOC125015804 [Mugil cephalus]
MKHLLLVILGWLLSPRQAHCRRDDRTNCKPLTASFCQGLGYTTSLYPNGAQGFNLQEIGQIVGTGCSPHIAMLMCRVAVPECGSEDNSQMKPCRSLCQKVKTECEPVLRTRRLFWPMRVRCESLPESNCVQGQVNPVTQATPSTCQTLTVPLCKELHYTETLLPNILGHQTQNDADQELRQYYPLVRVGCSPHLKPFLCSVYLPKCVSGQAQSPCRTLCEQARSSCEGLLNKSGMQWPEALNCEAFNTESCEHDPLVSVTQRSSTCQTITVPLCEDLPYTETALPGVLGHQTQEEAGLELHQFYPLVKVKCSPHIKPFLCSVYLPECVSRKPRPPCRMLCEQARSDCEPLLKKFGFEWPASLKCDAFSTESCEHYGVSSTGDICEPISIPMCQGLSYNQTIVPNLLGHTSQREAAMKMSFFSALVETVCSKDTRLFLCRVYAPQCVAGQVQRPCRTFCERAKRDCEGLTSSFGIAWPDELQCSSFPEEACVSEESRPEMLNVESVLAKLNAAGYSVRGKSLTLRTASLLLTLMDADKTRDLDEAEFFKLERYVAVVRREYVGSSERRDPFSVPRNLMKKNLSAREFDFDDETFSILWQGYSSQGGIDYDNYVAVLTKLQILKDRFQARMLNLPCDCQVASFSFQQFLKAAII